MQYLKNRVFNLIKRKLLDLWGNLTPLEGLREVKSQLRIAFYQNI